MYLNYFRKLISVNTSKARANLYRPVGFPALTSSVGESLIGIPPAHGGLPQGASLILAPAKGSAQAPTPRPGLPGPALWLPQLGRARSAFLVPPFSWFELNILNSVQAWDLQLGFKLAPALPH